MKTNLTREEAWELLRTYNKEEFHLRHAVTVEVVMRWYAQELGYEEEKEYWGIVGLLHDIDLKNFRRNTVKRLRSFWKRLVQEKILSILCAPMDMGYVLTSSRCMKWKRFCLQQMS